MSFIAFWLSPLMVVLGSTRHVSFAELAQGCAVSVRDLIFKRSRVVGLVVGFCFLQGQLHVAQGQERIVTGTDGVAVTISDVSRIVSLGGGVTEVVYALDAQANLVAVDQSSVYPAEARALPQVGYFRQISAEGILSMTPSLVLAAEGSGPPTSLTQLREAGVPVLLVPGDPSVNGAREKIQTIARALGKETEGQRLLATLADDVAHANQWLDGITTKPRVVFIYARGVGSMNVSGTGTAADAIIQLAGGENAVQAYPNYRPLTAEGLVQAAPDIILMPGRGLESIGGIDGLLDAPGVALTPAGRNRAIVAIDDLLLLGFGPRLGQAMKELAEALHPERRIKKM